MIIDVNLHLSRYPTRRLPADEPARLIDLLKKHDVARGWACSFDALLHKDISSVNRRIAQECAASGDRLLPVGAINPVLPGWQEDLRRCQEDHHMRVIRLHPNYHDYKLDDPLLEQVLAEATGRKMIVQISLNMEDDRTHHRMLRVPPLVITPLPKLLAKYPGARLMLLNNRVPLTKPLADQFRKAGECYFDIAMTESVENVARQVEAIGPDRVVFGSHAPFYVLESAMLKIRESAFPSDVANQVLSGNALKLLPEKIS